MNGVTERTLLLPGFATEKVCTDVALALGLEALRWRMHIEFFDCQPGNA